MMRETFKMTIETSRKTNELQYGTTHTYTKQTNTDCGDFYKRTNGILIFVVVVLVRLLIGFDVQLKENHLDNGSWNL